MSGLDGADVPSLQTPAGAMLQATLILGDVRRNLRDKFGWPEDRLSEVESVVTGHAEKVSPSETVDAVKADLTDNRILECALAANAGYVVTGDNHLLKLMRFGDIQIVRPADFLRMLDRQGQRER